MATDDSLPGLSCEHWLITASERLQSNLSSDKPHPATLAQPKHRRCEHAIFRHSVTCYVRYAHSPCSEKFLSHCFVGLYLYGAFFAYHPVTHGMCRYRSADQGGKQHVKTTHESAPSRIDLRNFPFPGIQALLHRQRQTCRDNHAVLSIISHPLDPRGRGTAL